MEYIVKLIPFSVFIALLTLIIKRDNPQIALLISISAIILFLLTLAQGFQAVSNFIKKMGEYASVSGDLFLPLIKILGISIVTGISSQLCRDANESALSYAVELLGVIAAVIIAMPLFLQVLSLILSLVKS